VRAPSKFALLAVALVGVAVAFGPCRTAPIGAPQASDAMPADASASRTCKLTRQAARLQNTTVTPLCDDVYAELGLTPAELETLRSAWDVAARSLQIAFETVRCSPVVVFCRSAACKMAFGASPEAAAADDLGFASAQVVLEDGSLVPSAVVVTGPVTATPRILTHELVHAEMKAWAPYDRLPTWFNEGTATFLAGEPHCAPNAPPNDFEVERLVTKTQWQRHLKKTRRTLETYCAARQAVERWLVRFDGEHARAEALKTLMAAVAGGTPFDEAFKATP
jgi:hypothetical protein